MRQKADIPYAFLIKRYEENKTFTNCFNYQINMNKFTEIISPHSQHKKPLYLHLQLAHNQTLNAINSTSINIKLLTQTAKITIHNNKILSRVKKAHKFIINSH